MENYVWKITQSLTFAKAEQHYQDWLNFVHKLKGDLVINLEQVTQCDSSGLALLIEAKQWANNHQKRCDFEAIPQMIYSLANFYSLDAILFN